MEWCSTWGIKGKFQNVVKLNRGNYGGGKIDSSSILVSKRNKKGRLEKGTNQSFFKGNMFWVTSCGSYLKLNYRRRKY